MTKQFLTNLVSPKILESLNLPSLLKRDEEEKEE